MTRIHTIGLDVSKNVFQVHGADKSGARVLKRKLQRKEVAGYFKRLKPCVVGVEATGGVHYWGRLLTAMGHTVKIMPAAYVKPYVKTNKNDVIDAEAICEAVRRPTMRFVPVKSETQQAVLTMHRARSTLTAQRVQVSNAMRGFLSEFGIIVPRHRQGTDEVLRLADGEPSRVIPPMAQDVLRLLAEQYRLMMKQIKTIDSLIGKWSRANPECKRLETIPGVGPIAATALVASIGDASQFRSGRQLAAWMGLVPRQYSSGGKTILGHIPKRGNSYLRRLFFMSSMSLIISKSKHRLTRWAHKLLRRKPYRVAVIALANKLVRIAWAILVRGGEFRAKARGPLPART